MPAPLSYDGFLLSRNWRDEHKGLVVELWVASDEMPLHIRLTGQEAVMFVERDQSASADRRAPVQLASLRGAPLDALYFSTQRGLVQERERLRARGVYPLEADIKPVERFLMERFVTGGLTVTGRSHQSDGVRHFENPRIKRSSYGPCLSLLSLDIETEGLTGPLLSIAGIHRYRRVSRPGGTTCEIEEESRVFLVRQRGAPLDLSSVPEITVFDDEGSALVAFCAWVADKDPDLLLGWNVIDFDLDYLVRLAKRLKVRLALGRAGSLAEISEPWSGNQVRVARVPGRVVLDGISTLRNATIQLESYSLADVAREMLSQSKDIEVTDDNVAEIMRMAREDPAGLAKYNLQDCRLVIDIFDHARLIDFAVERQSLTGLAMDRQGGSVAAFDQLYLPRLHRAGFAAPSVGDRRAGPSSPGGFVRDSVPGLHRNVAVLDFKSLYPSIIRTFLVDPLGLSQPGDRPVPGFDGGTFARQGHILPDLIQTLWSARDRAKSEKNAAMSQAIKIMMNSFYGVLGTPGCRFFDHRLVSSITKRGHQIIQQAESFLVDRGLQVIYGDTDSLFVLFDPDLDETECNELGQHLARELTAQFARHLRATLDVESHLELEYEGHFRRFFMPTMRGSDMGTKKRYAGASFTAEGHLELVFKGLEAVRTDWTPLARNFQRELFRRIFSDEPFEDYIRQITVDLRTGKLDDQLVYQKRLRKPLDEYTKNVPPHVQAARKAPQVGRRIRYAITKNGPEPASDLRSPLDYDHYLHAQLYPAAEGILFALNLDFARIAGPQLQLF